MCIRDSFRTPVSQKRFEISKCAKELIIANSKIYKFGSIHFFDIWNFWDISKKLFLKKLCQMLRFPKRAWLRSNYVVFLFFVFFFLCWESSLLWTAQSWQCFCKIRGGGCFLGISNPCISKTVEDIKTNMEVLGRLRPHFFSFFYLKVEYCP